jgi:hypothetical protein
MLSMTSIYFAQANGVDSNDHINSNINDNYSEKSLNLLGSAKSQSETDKQGELSSLA